MNRRFSQFLKWSCRIAGKPISFIIALLLLLVWAIIGMILGFSDTWLLVINTIATINATLMVFIIQNTQNRESKALHLKIDELLLSIKETEKTVIAIEEIEEEELDEIRQRLKMRHERKK